MPLLSAHKISKAYAHQTLFAEVNFGIEEKERIGFVGPNGAGKSTMLKILAGLIEPDSGTVSRKRGLKTGFLDQTPSFKKGARLLETILEKCESHDDSLSRAWELMARLELTSFGEDFEVAKLSGGWRKRVALARELVVDPELLFLDEPTNHLDLAGILWLEEFLDSAPFALMMITHDRLFLQRVTNRIVDLDPRNPNYLLSVNGDYAQYLESKELELAAQKRHEQVEKNRLRRETEWLRRGSLARQTKQSARIEAAADLKDKVENLQAKNQQRSVDLSFGEAERAPKRLIEAVGISKSYGERALFQNVDILITPKTRLGILGNNGSGKSTFIKVLLGLEPADSGAIKRADGVEVAYFEQSRETLLPELSVLKNICPEGDYVVFQGTSVHVRSYLDRFNFRGIKAEQPVKKLSGGEQARLRLAQLMLKQSQILVLDEPTNDLDIDMLESLENSLRDYNGAVILVTHDRYFLDAVANQILALGTSTPQKFASYFQWENWFKELQSAPAKKKVEEPRAVAKKTKLSFKEKYELENMESTILALESEFNSLRAESEDPKVIADHKRLSAIHARLAELQTQIDTKYARWSELAER